jgi:hypothetical protein
MATVRRWMLAVTLAFMILAPATNRATADQTNQNMVQCEGANTTGSTHKTSHPGPSCCAEVSPHQQIPKPERNFLHNAGGGKKTKTLRTRRKSDKSKFCQRQKERKIKRLSDEQTAAKTHNKKVGECIAQFIEFREHLLFN